MKLVGTSLPIYKMPKLNKNSSIPLYQQLARNLQKQIRSGTYQIGSQLPTERELMHYYEVSRNSVRQALDVLAAEGLVQRDQGRGTFVADSKLKLGLLRLTSFTEDMQERRLRPSSRLLKRIIEIPPAGISELLQLLPDEPALFVERLRFADDIPMAINMSYFSLDACPGLADEDLGNASIYALIETKYHIRLVQAKQTIRAAHASKTEAELLNISPNLPVLIMEGVVFTQDEYPIEHLRSIYRSDRYEFAISAIRTP
jgi:GntR family transcriptional regulator